MITEVNSSGRVPPWPRIQAVLGDRTPQAIALDGVPAVRLVVDGEHNELRLECSVADEAVSETGFDHLGELVVERTHLGGEWLSVWTRDDTLFPFFLAFASTVADEVQLDGSPVASAVDRSLRLFRRLLRDRQLLAPERQLGLLGELWALERLVAARGRDGLDAWLGPNAEAHDFRLDDVELEVKSTRRERALHIVNGLDQLKASAGAELYVVSIQYTAAGAGAEGSSLAEAIARVRTTLTGLALDGPFDAVLIDRFDLTPETEDRYTQRLKLRSAPRLIPIESRTPRLLRSDLDLIDRDEMHRVLDAEYTLDCDGLGVQDGSPEFLEIIP